MTLASLAVVSLVAVTWALIRVSAWIVHHDEVWGRMDREGAGREHWIAEWFNVAGALYLPVIEAAVGAVFLFFLWRALSAPPKPGGSPDVG